MILKAVYDKAARLARHFTRALPNKLMQDLTLEGPHRKENGTDYVLRLFFSRGYKQDRYNHWDELCVYNFLRHSLEKRGLEADIEGILIQREDLSMCLTVEIRNNQGDDFFFNKLISLRQMLLNDARYARTILHGGDVASAKPAP